MSVLGVIPARYGSTRFPGKALTPIAGKPMIQHVWERVSRSERLSRVVVATDDERIRACVTGFGGEALLTSPEHPSGTDRLGEVAARLPADYYVNTQGDEPLISPAAIDELVDQVLSARAPMGTLVRRLSLPADEAVLADPNVVKAVRGDDGYALYFSRAAVPYPRRPEEARFYKHIGIYMYSHAALMRLCGAPQTSVERAESLEQLRALENGIDILVLDAPHDSWGVDTPEDLERAELILARERAAH